MRLLVTRVNLSHLRLSSEWLPSKTPERNFKLENNNKRIATSNLCRTNFFIKSCKNSPWEPLHQVLNYQKSPHRLLSINIKFKKVFWKLRADRNWLLAKREPTCSRLLLVTLNFLLIERFSVQLFPLSPKEKVNGKCQDWMSRKIPVLNWENKTYF